MIRFALVPLLGCLLASPAWAQDTKLAVTDPTQADSDFARQGEYAGPGWGLQVVAAGDGKFQALLHPGGLPGAGWNRGERQKLAGAVEGQTLELKGDEYSARVSSNYADVIDAQGRVIARLVRWNRGSTTLGLRPWPNAVVLFDGTSGEQFVNAKLTDDGLLRMGTMTKDKVGDFRLHLEFRLPYMPYARGQGRANSGVYIQQRYEVQILDSFGLEGLKNECAALYQQQPPDVNATLPPLSWQTYDIWFRQARWSKDGQTKLEPARITVFHNGIPVHWNYELTNKTGGGKPEGPEEFPIALQDHGNPVVFRNIWMVPGQGDFPMATTVPTKVATGPVRPRPAPSCPPRRGLLRRIFACCR